MNRGWEDNSVSKWKQTPTSTNQLSVCISNHLRRNLFFFLLKGTVSSVIVHLLMGQIIEIMSTLSRITWKRQHLSVLQRGILQILKSVFRI